MPRPIFAPTARRRCPRTGILTGKIVECPWHFGTFDVTCGKPTGMPCTIALKTFAIKVIEESVYVEF